MVFGFEFGGLHAAAVVLHNDGGVSEDIRHGDVDCGGLGVPGVIHEFLQRLFTLRVALTQHVGELGIDSEVGGFLHGRKVTPREGCGQQWRRDFSEF